MNLRDEMMRLPRPQGAGWWQEKRQQLWDAVVNGGLENPLESPIVRSTMYIHGIPKYVDEELQEIQELGGLGFSLFDLAQETGLHRGHLIHQAYPLMLYSKRLRPDTLHGVVEFGPGIGAMAILLQRLGYKDHIINVDFPEHLVLQRWLHDRLGVDNVTYWKSHLDLPSTRCDLVIALWSLSEAPRYQREAFLRQLAGRDIIAAYQSKWHDIDNDEFFREVIDGEFIPAHLPGNTYAIGKIKEIKW